MLLHRFEVETSPEMPPRIGCEQNAPFIDGSPILEEAIKSLGRFHLALIGRRRRNELAFNNIQVDETVIGGDSEHASTPLDLAQQLTSGVNIAALVYPAPHAGDDGRICVDLRPRQYVRLDGHRQRCSDQRKAMNDTDDLRVRTIKNFGYCRLPQKYFAQFIEARLKFFRRLTNEVLQPVITDGTVIFTRCRVELFTGSIGAKLLESTTTTRFDFGRDVAQSNCLTH